MKAQVIGFLPSAWEIWIEYPAPAFLQPDPDPAILGICGSDPTYETAISLSSSEINN